MGIYCDIVSGTKKEKRPELQQLLTDCRDGRVNLVLTKSISRFARNTLDCLKYIRRLKADSIDGSKTTANGFDVPHKWNYEGLDYLLQNEKYSGDLLLQKYYTVDYLTKKAAVNEGQVPQYLAENNHPPVIPKEVFLQTQEEMARRRQNPSDFHYLHNWPLTGRIICFFVSLDRAAVVKMI